MSVVLTYGTFDLFHVGHVRLLKRLKGMGDRLIVGCSTDEFNSLKGKSTVIPYADRREILESCRFVDFVFPENSWDQKPSDVKRFGADIFAIGEDWSGKFDFLEADTGCKVVYVPRTPGISTTDLKGALVKIEEERMHAVLLAAEKLRDMIGSITVRS
jgi:glycerol-3-phosphate cytidylyltransferase